MFISTFQPPSSKLIIRLDPSSKSRTTCARNFYYNNLLGFTSKKPSAATEFGQAVHQACAALRKGASLQDAKDIGLDYYLASPTDTTNDYRTAALLLEVMDEYLPGRRPERDKFKSSIRNAIPAIEMPFEIPYRAFEHADFTLCGVIDELGTLDDNQRFLDIKTTGLFPQKFSTKWGTNHQMLFYSYVLRAIGYSDRYLSPVIDAIFIRTKQGQRVRRITDTVILPDHVDEYMDQVWNTCEQIYGWLLANDFKLNRTCCETVFGDCNYRAVCDSHPKLRDSMLNSMYKQKEYNPATFGVNE